MKRFWCIAIACIISLNSSSGFFAPIAYAQTQTTSNPASSFEERKQQGLSDINAQISYIASRLSDTSLKTTWGGDTDSRWISYKTSAPKFQDLLRGSLDLFTTNFEKAKQGGASADASYRAALLSVVDLINKPNTQLFNGNIINADRARITTVINQLINEPIRTAIESGDPQAVANAEKTVAQTATARNNQVEAGKCTSLFNSSVVDCLDAGFAWLIKNTLLQIAGFLVWLTANMLNYAIQIGILQFSDLAKTSDFYAIWLVVRQIISLFVVFSGLYLGFMYIIGKGDAFAKYVPWILMFGLFVNFSYPLVRTLIDISNIISLNAYSAAMGADVLANGGANSPGAMIASRLGLAGLLAGATSVEGATNTIGALTSINSVPAALLAVVFVAYAAWVFFVATGVIIARTIILIFMIIGSPLLFVDSVIPALGQRAMEMRKLFFGQLIVAPVFMILLSVTIKFLDIFNKAAGSSGVGGSAINAIGGGTSTYQTFVSLLLMIGALKVMITITRNLSGKFGDFATNTLGTVGGFALGAASGGAGLLARGTIGRKALNFRDGDWMKNNQHTFVGRQAYNLTNSLSSSTFDARNNTFLKSKTDKLGLGMGMGSKLGFEQSKEAREKARADHVDRVQSRIQTRYTKDTLGKDGVLHKAGDIDTEGMKAMANLRKDENSLANKAIRKVTGTDAPDAVFEKANERMTAEDRKMLEEQKGELVNNYEKNPETGKKNSTADKAKILAQLDNDKQDALKADPGQANIRTQALVTAVKAIENKKKEDDAAFEKKVKSSVEVYKTLAQAKQATYLAQLEEELQDAVKLELSGGRSTNSTSSTVSIQSQGGTQASRAPLNVNQANTQAFANQSQIPAYQRRGMNNPAVTPSVTTQSSTQVPASVTTPVAPAQQTANLSNNMAQALGGSRPQVTTASGFKQFNFAQHAATPAPKATPVRPIASVPGTPLSGAPSTTTASNAQAQPGTQATPQSSAPLPKAA